MYGLELRAQGLGLGFKVCGFEVSSGLGVRVSGLGMF